MPTFLLPIAGPNFAPPLLRSKIAVEKGGLQGKTGGGNPREVPQRTREESKPVIALSKLMLEEAEYPRELAKLMQAPSETEKMFAELAFVRAKTLFMVIETDARAPETDARVRETTFCAP